MIPRMPKSRMGVFLLEPAPTLGLQVRLLLRLVLKRFSLIQKCTSGFNAAIDIGTVSSACI